MKEHSKIGIIPFTAFGETEKVGGSTFLRVDGLIAHSDRFEIWRHGHQYDGLIFQKAYWQEMLILFKGPKILDLCDVDWMNKNIDIIQIIQSASAVTCSSPELTALICSYVPNKLVVHIPDRLNFNQFPEQRMDHRHNATNVLWFGYIKNAHQALAPFAKLIKELGLSLTILANRDYEHDDEIKKLAPRFIKYEQTTAHEYIRNADIVLNTKLSIAPYKYKSNNKTIISLKLGVPVAHSPEDLLRLMDPIERNLEIREKVPLVINEYNIEKSIAQYLAVFDEISSY